MLLRFYFLFFLTIITYVKGVAQIEGIVFQDVRNVISSNPDSFLVQAEKGDFPKGLNRRKQLFLYALAAEKVSEYNKNINT